MVLSSKEGQIAILPQASTCRGAKLSRKEQWAIFGVKRLKDFCTGLYCTVYVLTRWHCGLYADKDTIQEALRGIEPPSKAHAFGVVPFFISK